ncbi:hypothetical protein RO3G_12270 [Rhizopus delemar RA 99-880]|uniref:F-box domain-containing protein n=1 Tax=Rhizopus delemar (strain RA 99-880 / ATCC MYA-4621 / FGSC 9543 / NRRL 43880) TaxID=246409 RepID=I1CGH9_RHIO9|nr:hypothetical protein RO3G_12270 [Rhizopus delemar RA 99-880]|eukprot:EIE87559.1 hypothetical protein RO3G_12270 [Rhizopus delemar RA 99-880]
MLPIQKLPFEILQIVVSYLNKKYQYNCLFVNKAFYAAAIPELWRNPHFSYKRTLCQFIRSQGFSKHQLGNRVKSMLFTYDTRVRDTDFLNIFPFTPNLEELDIRQPEELTEVSSELLSNCYETAHDLRSFAHLKHLTLSCCKRMPIEFISFITVDDQGQPYLPHLQKFAITKCDMNDHVIIPFIKTHPNLSDLILPRSDITDATLKTIACYLPKLTRLYIASWTQLSMHVVHDLVISCKSLMWCSISARHDFIKPAVSNTSHECLAKINAFVDLNDAFCMYSRSQAGFALFEWNILGLNLVRSYYSKNNKK